MRKAVGFLSVIDFHNSLIFDILFQDWTFLMCTVNAGDHVLPYNLLSSELTFSLNYNSSLVHNILITRNFWLLILTLESFDCLILYSLLVISSCWEILNINIPICVDCRAFWNTPLLKTTGGGGRGPAHNYMSSFFSDMLKPP